MTGIHRLVYKTAIIVLHRPRGRQIVYICLICPMYKPLYCNCPIMLFQLAPPPPPRTFSVKCEGNLVCFKRRGQKSVPGCIGTGITSKDYCTHPETLITSPDAYGGCPPPLRPKQPCLLINTYTEFKRAVENASRGETIVFCEFTVTKTARDKPTEVSQTDIHIACQSLKKCTINGDGEHIKFYGNDAKGIIQGFTFMHATENAIRIWEGTNSYEQKICHCDFIK